MNQRLLTWLLAYVEAHPDQVVQILDTIFQLLKSDPKLLVELVKAVRPTTTTK